MARFKLSELIRRARNPRRKVIPLRDIAPPATLATNLYRSCYMPVVQTWERALPGVMAEYERSLAQVTTDGYTGRETGVVPERFNGAGRQGPEHGRRAGSVSSNLTDVRLTDSAADIESGLGMVDSLLQRLYLELTPRLRDWLVRTEDWHRSKWRGAALSATGVDLDTMIGPTDVAETLDTLLARNVALVKDVGSQARARISDAVFRGLTNRLPARDVARDIRDAVDMSRQRSLRIASDQLSKLSSALDTERMSQAGIEQFKYVHSGKLHARPWHRARDGKIYDLLTRQEVDGSDVIEADDMPGVPPYCGCRKQAHITFD